MIIIPREMQGQRIDSVLAQLLPNYSRSQLSQWLKAGVIKVNDRTLKSKEKVKGGESIFFPAEELLLQKNSDHIEPEAIALDIIFEDEEFLVINKPVGLIVHPGAGNKSHTLANALLYHRPNLAHLPRAGIIHRLDKDTTGLLIIAKTINTHTYLVRQMQNRQIKRTYRALVQGHLIAGGEINTFYGRHPRNRLKMAVCKQGKQAITFYTIKKHYSDYTLLNVELLTGRTHQIRVHMAHIHHPIVGDPLYGARSRLPKEAPQELITALQSFKRQALHAHQLVLTHPLTQKHLTFESPIPDDFQNLITTLDNYLA